MGNSHLPELILTELKLILFFLEPLFELLDKKIFVFLGLLKLKLQLLDFLFKEFLFIDGLLFVVHEFGLEVCVVIFEVFEGLGSFF